MPLKPVQAYVELHNARDSPFVKTTSLGGMTLVPFYSLKQIKAALLRHAFETAKQQIRRSTEHPLEDCLTTPYLAARPDDDRSQAYSIGFMYEDKAMPRNAFERRDIVSKTKTGQVWVDIKQSNILTILTHTEEGRGNFVVRVWMYSPSLEKQKKRYGSYDIGESLDTHVRACEAGSLAGGSGAGSGSGSEGCSGAWSKRREDGVVGAAGEMECLACHHDHVLTSCVNPHEPHEGVLC